MKVALFANTEWYLYNFRRSLASHLRDLGHDVLLLSPPGEYGERLSSLGFDWRPLPMRRRSLNLLQEARLIYRLHSILVAENVDVIHGFTIKPAVYSGLAARTARIAGSVSSVTGLGYVFTSADLLARLLRPVVRGLLHAALSGPRSALIVQNHDDGDFFLRQRLCRETDIHLIPGSGVDCGKFLPAAEADKQPEKVTVLLAARLLWDKGVGEYVEAATLLKAQGVNCDFVLAGSPDEGNPASIPVRTVNGWVESGLLRWLGHVEDMRALYAAADIVVLPSYREGLPRSLIEAAACGLPQVSTDVPGCREVVDEGVTGYKVPVGDAAALAAAIGTLVCNPELRTQMGTAARARALRLYDDRLINTQTLGVYTRFVPPDTQVTATD